MQPANARAAAFRTSHREPSCAARLFLQRYRRTTAESVAVGNAGAKTKALQEFEKIASEGRGRV
jgi:hypothetical protein